MEVVDASVREAVAEKTHPMEGVSAKPIYCQSSPVDYAEVLRDKTQFADIAQIDKAGGLDGDAVAANVAQAFSMPALAGVRADRDKIFAAVKRWALDALANGPTALVPTAPGAGVDVREFTAKECRGILANAMLGNVLDVMLPFKTHRGGLHFNRLLSDRTHEMNAHKLACLLLYFGALPSRHPRTGPRLETK